MASSFNFDLDKYIEKRKSKEEADVARVPPSKKKKPKGKLAALIKLKDALKSLLDADEVLNFDANEERNSVSVYHKKTLTDKLTDIVAKSKDERSRESGAVNSAKEVMKDKDSLQKSQQNSSSDVDEYDDDFLREQKRQERQNRFTQNRDQDILTTIPFTNSIASVNESSKESSHDSSHSFFGTHQHVKSSSRDRVSQEAVNRTLRDDETGYEPVSTSARLEFRNDLREIVKINYRVIKKLPPETIRLFRESADFKQFVAILDKYDLIKHHDDANE